MILRLLLRVLSLAAKFGLTIVIARKLGFSAVADYGLAVAASVIASKLFGLGFSSEVNRRLSGEQPVAAIHTARSLRYVYGALYVTVLACAWIASREGWLAFAHTSSLVVMVEILLVAIAEHYALEASSYVFSLHHAKAGSFMLFIRTGVWAVVAIVGLFAGVIANMHAIFALWIGANLVVIVWAWMIIGADWRSRDDRVARTAEGAGAREVWAGGILFYVAGVMLAALQYVERFIASPYLSHEDLGRYVFSWSVANAVQTVAFASIVVTAGPRFAKIAAVAPQYLHTALRHSSRSLLVLTVLIAGCIALAHGPVFRLAHENAGTDGVVTLFILLISFVLRSVADLLWTAAIAQRAARAVVPGMLLAAAVCVPAAFWIIPGHGQTGVALAHLLTSAFIVVWLARVVGRTPGGRE
jgi:O-antigen/teichoic acid export membrane protein